jgi:hypothetical protein
MIRRSDERDPVNARAVHQVNAVAIGCEIVPVGWIRRAGRSVFAHPEMSDGQSPYRPVSAAGDGAGVPLL